MKTLFNSLALLFILMLFTACPSEVKSEQQATGTYSGMATATGNAANAKTLSITIAAAGNPVSGTYTLGSGTSAVTGDVSGSALGLIYSLTLKPKTAGITYSVSTTWDGENTMTGTMKGTENGSVVTYNFVLKRQ